MGKIYGFYTMPHPPIAVPEVGRGQETKIKNTLNACYKVGEEIASIKPDTIIIITPHGPMFSDAVAVSYENNIHGDLEKFGAPEVSQSSNINLPLTEKIIEYSKEQNILIGKITTRSAQEYGMEYELDHGALVPLYFVNKKYPNYKLVHITYGMLSKMELYKFGMCIKKAVNEVNTKAVFIASGDLSHRLTKDGPYEYSPYGEKFDREITSLLEKGDVLKIFNMDKETVNEAGECGLKSYYIMLGAMDGCDIKGKILSYEGPFGVGYGVMSFSLKDDGRDTYSKLTEERQKIIEVKRKTEDPYVRLARESLTSYLVYHKYLENPDYITDEMKNNKRGVFVSMKKEGQLRGCIGTIFPTTKNTAEEIIKNAVSSGINDPRFMPVRKDELEDIDFSVDVLTKPEEASKGELDPERYGVIVQKGSRCGLLLPDLEGVDTVDKQLQIALEKGNISPNEDYTIEKFEVIRHK
ncbi:AmmeMemoRadiSam system protein A [Clostridium sp. AWRP]|uniref:AmmeMemoRadiSam system protein A n=1 Tax=Clostridium sp. AWRP TaxID=2212991 RepID=UPI000FDB0820|nr:AmmeMemoRadiSam system protein A [Clostridium sp. AWRP]AZV56352.1 AmmeMemoRadiSam system protein A [Clostridium sp. AWRP]